MSPALLRPALLVAVMAPPLASAVAACDDDAAVPFAPPPSTVSDAGATGDQSAPPPPPTDGGLEASLAAAATLRGAYLVTALAGCGDCHSPRWPDGGVDPDRDLGGVDCFVRAGYTWTADGGLDASVDGGCLPAPNLTPHTTGLGGRTDAEVKAMLQRGLRADGGALHPLMPSAQYANLTDADVDAIVRYLRARPAIDHAVPAPDPAWRVAAPAPAIALGTVPLLVALNAESAQRGRYLATAAAGCIGCHTPESSPGRGDFAADAWFTGSRPFVTAAYGAAPPGAPPVVWSSNLTPHATGLASASAADIVSLLLTGRDAADAGVCAPVLSGPHRRYAQMTALDAVDLANYLRALPPVDRARPADCAP